MAIFRFCLEKKIFLPFSLKWLKLETESSIYFIIQYGTPQKNEKMIKMLFMIDKF